MKSPEEIKAAIERLKENKAKTKRYNAFNEDNHAAIDAGIEVLESNLSEDVIYDRLDSEEWEQNEFDFALSMNDWKNNSDSIEDYLYPEN